GIKRTVEERLARIDHSEPDDAAKVPFLEGAAMTLDAAAEFGKRFAAKAREQAEGEADPTRKADLLKIAEVCDWVPANPARTFYEAIQSCYFAWLLTCWENSHVGGQSLGRMDQYLYPYYENDMKEERITKAEAQELVDCLLIKLNHGPPVAAVTVGGLRADGNDATNELSYMFIEGMMHTRLRQPYFSVQVHHKMPDDLLIKACKLCSLGTGHPEFINNDVIVAQALARGSMGGPPVTLEDARSAAPIGCLEMGIPGKDSGYLYFQQPNLAACMDLVMTNGVRRTDHEKTGVETGDPGQFKSFEEVREAYRKQVAWMRRNIQIAGSKREQTIIECAPTPYESALIEDCIEKGMCRELGGAYYNFNIGGAALGSSDAGDSLAAIKKLVFEDKRFTMAELCDALDHNFEGHEALHRMLLKAPKFGNDDDYADEQLVWVMHEWVSEFTKLKNMRGGYGCPGGSVMGSYVPAGLAVGALPSGRLAAEPLADAASPSPGKDLEGPTAVLKSMGKVDNVEILGGVILNLRIDPSVFRDGDVRRLVGLIRTFVDQKIYHVQINVVSTETLRAAQKEPEKHRDLVVKVAGYNVFFTQLGKTHQDSIIARTEHGI
ncbi:MAG: glycyl radical protein, partial [Candidatus Hydrogenedentes bacterium]|nr:glycyl radical protein [Candidatus Hydrogenedentota bacterium]